MIEKVIPAHEGYEVVSDDFDGLRLPVIAWSTGEGVPRAITPLGECSSYDALIVDGCETFACIDGRWRRYPTDDDWRDAVKAAKERGSSRRAVRSRYTPDHAYVPPRLSIAQRFRRLISR